MLLYIWNTRDICTRYIDKKWNDSIIVCQADSCLRHSMAICLSVLLYNRYLKYDFAKINIENSFNGTVQKSNWYHRIICSTLFQHYLHFDAVKLNKSKSFTNECRLNSVFNCKQTFHLNRGSCRWDASVNCEHSLTASIHNVQNTFIES